MDRSSKLKARLNRLIACTRVSRAGGFQYAARSLEKVVQRIGMHVRPSGLRGGQLKIERDRDPARDLVLQREQIAREVVEPFRPQMRVFLGVDKLGIDADPATQPPDAPFQHDAQSWLASALAARVLGRLTDTAAED